MSWFKLDDKMAFHRKVLKAGNESVGAWARAGCWSSEHGTDGSIPWEVATTIAPRPVWDRLIDSGLCDTTEDDSGLLLHDFLDWNPSAAQVVRVRNQRAKSGALGGKQKASKTLANASKDAEGSLPCLPAPCSDSALAKVCPVPVPDPRREEDPPYPPNEAQAPRVESVRETARRAYGEGIRTVVDGPLFAMSDEEAAVLTKAIGQSPRWVSLRGERLAKEVRKSAADYARANKDRARFESGFSPHKWLEWLRSCGPKASLDSADKFADRNREAQFAIAAELERRHSQ